MKNYRRILATVMSMALVSGLMAGCGKAATPATEGTDVAVESGAESSE